MLILQEKSTPLNLQFLSVGNEFDSSLIGRYAVVNLSNKRSFICKVWPKSFLHNDFCVLDPSVELLSNSSTPAAKELNLEGQHLSRNNVKAISHVNIIKSLSLIVVFKDPWQRMKWDNKEAALIDSLRELLKLFIISSKSIVNVDSLTEFDIFGIYSLNILSTGCGYGRIVKSTKIKIDSKISLMTYDQLYRNVDENEIFYWNAYKDLNAVIETRSNILNPDRSLILEQDSEDESITFVQQVLLVGAGGCGKSTLVHKVCFDNEVVLLYLDLSEMLTLKHDERQLYFKDKLKLAKALSDEATSGICMILIKRVENISSKSGKPLEMLNSFLEDAGRNPKIIVVATTDFPLALDASLRTANKFSVEVYLNIPTETERFRLVEVIVRQLPFKMNLSGRSCLYIALNTPGFVFADLVLLFRKAAKTIQSQNITEEDDVLNVFKSCVKTVQPTSTKGIIGLVPSSNYNINNLGGLFEIKSKLIQLIVWPIVNSESLRQMNVPPPSGCLLYGPPGCAKTSLVRAVASSYKTTFLSVSAAHLYSPFLGDAEKIITQLFQRARSSAPTVLFIDEIDALVGSRTNRDSGVQERILSAFLTELDGIGFKKDAEHSLNENYNPIVTIVAATNRPQNIDSALLRPGRFDKLIYVPPPNVEERHSILKIVTSGLSLDSNISLTSIAEKTEYYSGADLVSLCREAGLRALAVGGEKVQSISVAHFDYALENIKPSLSEEQVPELHDDIRIPEYCCLSETEDDPDVDINAWFGPRGTVSPLHHDPKHNLLTQVIGRKRILLYGPEYNSNLYPYEGKILSNTSEADPEKPDYTKHPDFAKAVSYECHLYPGEMLYIPPKWWHHVRSLDISFSVSFWWM